MSSHYYTVASRKLDGATVYDVDTSDGYLAGHGLTYQSAEVRQQRLEEAGYSELGLSRPRRQRVNRAGWDLAATVASDAAEDIRAYVRTIRDALKADDMAGVAGLLNRLEEAAGTYDDDSQAYQAGEYSDVDRTTGRVG